MAWFGYKGFHAHAIKREEIARVQKAKDTFIKSVHDSLKGLYPIPSNWPKDSSNINYILKGIFDDLQVTVNNFRVAVPDNERVDFDKAWFIYRAGTDPVSKTAEQEYHQYMGFTINDHYIDPRKQLLPGWLERVPLLFRSALYKGINLN